MGIEDSAILGGLLAQNPSTTTLHSTLLLYSQLREHRVARISEASIFSRWYTQMPDGPEQRARDQYCIEHPGIHVGHENIRSRKEFLNSLFGYDALKVVKDVAEGHMNGHAC